MRTVKKKGARYQGQNFLPHLRELMHSQDMKNSKKQSGSPNQVPWTIWSPLTTHMNHTVGLFRNPSLPQGTPIFPSPLGGFRIGPPYEPRRSYQMVQVSWVEDAVPFFLFILAFPSVMSISIAPVGVGGFSICALIPFFFFALLTFLATAYRFLVREYGG